MKAIHAERITKTYPGRSRKAPITALDDFSLDVSKGEIFGLLGPNGAGKTTFIKTILHIIFPDAGSATLFGENVKNHNVKQRVGYLPENHRYPTHLTGAGVLRYFGKLSGMASEELDARVPALLEKVDMSNWAKVRIKKYSKGMMQRIGLAQAMINNPELLILDEPTDGVDPVGRKEIRDILFGLKEQGITIFLNSHLLSEVEMICDRVAILNKGKLVRIGSVEELTRQERRYTITITGAVSDAMKMNWEATRKPVAINGHTLTVNTKDVETVNALIDELRQAGMLIESVIPVKQSLEDIFIQTVEGK